MLQLSSTVGIFHPVNEVKEHINQLSSQVIRESSSPYASPIVLVREKDASILMCVDYSQLNRKTRKIWLVVITRCQSLRQMD